MKRDMEIVNKIGTYTIDTISYISEKDKEFQKYMLVFNENSDLDGKLDEPYCVEVNSLYDKCVKEILGPKYNKLMNLIKDTVEPHQCHRNAFMSGLDIVKECGVSVFFCCGFINSIMLHCILYITDGEKGVFIDPTEVANGWCHEEFDLYYFSPLNRVKNMFLKEKNFYIPLVGFDKSLA